MTLRHLKIFLAVCECDCNVTRAAERLYLAQPAVSVALRELEEHYGVRLFDRLSRRLSLTGAGARFREYAVHIASLFDELEQGLRDGDAFGLLRVGASVTIGSQLLPGYVEAFHARRPEVDMRVQVAPSELLEQKLLINELDLALIEGVVHEPSLIYEDYMEDSLTVVCPADGAFRQGERIPLDVFCKQRFLLRERGSGTREEFESTMQAAGLSIEPVWEATSTTALVNAVIHGLGVAVLPRRMVRGPVERGLVAAVTVEGLEFKRRFRIVYHKNKFLTNSAREFLDLCRHYELDYPVPRYHGLY